ncbi:hypothetical protein [Pseudoalteromonas sp. NZS37]|jgi:hypothetical protein|uniref:hypothetical protein n=1 Tax=Pseudoalteromonas sp. NZS37 TaxID=2792071 RepID=UPI0018CEDD50|nr:hypothetical protein [Pseudoalteromonas sp. NZS37]MBG9990968.1 hypothetical protein [Pseudoalteromonas sp. NZS37]
MKSLYIASLSTVLTVFVVTFVVTAIDSIGSDYTDIRISLLIASVAAIVALIVVMVWALPVHFALKKLNHQGFFWYLLASVVPCVVFIYAFKPFGQDSNIDLIKQTLFCSFCGCIGAGIFWYMAVYRQRITSA